MLRRRGDDLSDEQRLSIVEEMDGEVRELTELVTELVSSATGGGSLNPDAFDEVDLVMLSEEAAERTRKRTGRAISVRGDGQSRIMGDRGAIERAIGNLIGNAVKFSPAESPIEVCVLDQTVTVNDRGPGIPEDELERVFDRFYRSDATRTMPGSGLGLAIVAEIATAHGGSTFAHTRKGGGASVGFSLGKNWDL